MINLVKKINGKKDKWKKKEAKKGEKEMLISSFLFENLFYFGLGYDFKFFGPSHIFALMIENIIL